MRLGRGLLVISLLLAGCRDGSAPPSAPAPEVEAPVPIRLIVVDDPPLAEAIEAFWQSRGGGELELRELERAQLETARQLVGDVIIYPSSCLGLLAERELIAPLPESLLQSSELALRDVFELQRSPEVRWGRQVFAVSFGSPQLVLLYRADLFQELELRPPETWPQYQEVAGRLARAQLPAPLPPDTAWTPIIEPTSDGWAAKVLLARAAAYARHPSQYSSLFDFVTMDPLIAGPPFVRALEEMAAAHRLMAPQARSLTPAAARQAFWEGQAAMVMTWPTQAGDAPRPTDAAALPAAGWAQLPGAEVAYDFAEQSWTPREDDASHVALLAVAGRLGSITRTARRPGQAGDLLTRLTGVQDSPLISPRSPATTLFRHSHLKEPAVWTDHGLPVPTARDYAELVERTQTRPAHLDSLRIPGRARYLAVLDAAVRQACAGEREAAAALADVATEWSRICDELGRDAQRIAYMHSLGLEP